MVKNLDLHGDASILVGELEGIAHEIQKHLEYPPLVSMHCLNKIKVILTVNLSFKVDTSLVGWEVHDLEGLID